MHSSDITCFIVSCVLFFLAVPGIVLCIPRNANKYKRAAVHSILFGLVFVLAQKFAMNFGNSGPAPFEGFAASAASIKELSKTPATKL